MKQATQKKRALTLVTEVTESLENNTSKTPQMPRRPVHDWRCGLPFGRCEHFRELTIEEFVKVNLATIRESSNHRAWPYDVVAKFTAAEVIERQREQ
jgi:hypothetical protein